MNHYRTAALVAAVLLLIGSAAVLTMTRQPADSRVYTIAQVQAGLQHAPAAWIGRTIRVRARVIGIVLDVALHRPVGAVSNMSILIALPGPYCPSATIGCGFSPKFLAPSPITAVQLSDGVATSAPALLASVQSEPSWLRALRHIPWVSGLFAPPQPLTLDGTATYRLRILPTSRCRQLCADAVLLDSAAP